MDEPKQAKGLAPLWIGLALISVGALFFLQNFTDLDVAWWRLTWIILAGLFMFWGLAQIYRHFTWPEDLLRSSPSRSNLASGLLKAGLGGTVLLGLLDLASFSYVFGKFWPLLLILFGIGKIIDFYRFDGRLQFRGREIVAALLMIFLGLLINTADNAHLPLVEADGIPFFIRLPIDDWREDNERPVLTRTVTEQIAADGVTSLQVNNIYGNLEIRGDQSASQVSITLEKAVGRRSRGDADSIADELKLVTRREGETLVITTNRGDHSDSKALKTHFKLTVPAGLKLKAINGYGRLKVAGLRGDCVLENERGILIAEDIVGSLDVRNRFKGTTVREIQGAVKIESRRATVRVVNVSGNVRVRGDRDRLELRGISGEVDVKNNHGRLSLDGASGRVSIDGPGTDVTVENAVGPVEIIHSYDDLNVSGIEKELLLTAQHSRLTLKGLKGKTGIEIRQSSIKAEDIAGALTVRGVSTSISATDVAGPVDIVTSLKDVRLSDFKASVKIQNKDGGDIKLTASEPLQGDITAENTNGDISLTLNSDSSFQLSAQTRGRISSDFGDDRRSDGGRTLDVTQGGGRHRVRLQSEFSNIRVKKADR